ncbi:uncharacterized protein LOC128724607 [Anopheles nili]|uniref:uncharacterized protein LOC128724607 n=1 Tax=Anopheles nili TaxID=185578 RepID=UPI00237B4C5A|nr:uncharacterized protein LOC128724607 [Anopheles nili]
MASKVGPRIDARAPHMYVEDVLKTRYLVRDIERHRVIVRENKELLKRINQIYRTKGFLHINYSYRVHQSLNLDARTRKARAIELQNRALLNRLLRRKATVDSNLPREKKLPWWLPPANRIPDGQQRVLIDFWERTDRRLCRLVIDLCPEVSPDEITLGRGKLFRIYAGTMLVVRAGSAHFDEEPLDGHETLQNVRRGSFVKQMQDGREYYLVTLRTIESIADGKLLGRVASGAMDKLDLIDFYGSKFGRCKDPLFFDTFEQINY